MKIIMNDETKDCIKTSRRQAQRKTPIKTNIVGKRQKTGKVDNEY